MENRVGHHVPSKHEAELLVTALDQARKSLEKFTVELTPDERRRLVKAPANGSSLVELVAGLAERHGVALGQAATVEDLRRDLELAGRIEPILRAAQATTSRLEDTLLEARSEAWWAATAFYSALSRMAETDPGLLRELEPVVDYFSRRKRGRAPGRPSPSETPEPVTPPHP